MESNIGGYIVGRIEMGTPSDTFLVGALLPVQWIALSFELTELRSNSQGCRKEHSLKNSHVHMLVEVEG